MVRSKQGGLTYAVNIRHALGYAHDQSGRGDQCGGSLEISRLDRRYTQSCPGQTLEQEGAEVANALSSVRLCDGGAV